MGTLRRCQWLHYASASDLDIRKNLKMSCSELADKVLRNVLVGAEAMYGPPQ
jgi:hypothetical protein